MKDGGQGFTPQCSTSNNQRHSLKFIKFTLMALMIRKLLEIYLASNFNIEERFVVYVEMSIYGLL
jgi:hypothetical protein